MADIPRLIHDVLGDLKPTEENIEALQDMLLVLDQEGKLPLDSEFSEFLQHALDLMEKGETVVFMSTEPKELPEGWAADNSYEVPE